MSGGKWSKSIFLSNLLFSRSSAEVKLLSEGESGGPLFRRRGGKSIKGGPGTGPSSGITVVLPFAVIKTVGN